MSDADRTQAIGKPGANLDPTLAVPLGVVAAEDLASPQSFGHYRILRVLGEGGMGIVYEAEQDQPRRRVALKVIKPGLANAEMLRRFELEAQALGRLQHPGIAQIYEAGTAQTPFGAQPYFAMEFVEGQTFLDYLASHEVNTRQRLKLIALICEAVHHAHPVSYTHLTLPTKA